MAKVVARVISQKGCCSAGHKVGEEFIMEDHVSPGICTWAFYAIFPFMAVLQYGGTFPWEKDPGKTTVACPDAENPLVFELRRDEAP